jgi:hypothetical protein
MIGGRKAVEKPGQRRPWKSQERFPLSHSFGDDDLSLTTVIIFCRIQLPASLRSDD